MIRTANRSVKLRVCIIFAGLVTMPMLSFAIKGKIAIIYNQQNKTLRFTAAEMKRTLEKKEYVVVFSDIRDLAGIKAPDRIILTIGGTDGIPDFLAKKGVNHLSSVPQGYSVRRLTYVGYKDWYVIGSDARGIIYGGLDISETIQLKGFDALNETDKQPYILNRGIKFNIPLDARTPSYSDNSDAAQQNIANMWDAGFWHEFLDEMARGRFNMLSLWSLSPFPSLTDVPEYPRAGLQDVMKTTAALLPTTDAWYMSTPASLSKLVPVKRISLAGKIAFWREIMQYASDRGIDCYLFTWNLFVYGTENSGYGFTDKISDSRTKDYIRKATSALIKTYPLLKGIGLTAGENMYKLSEADKERFLFESYGEGINDALREDTARIFKLIHRAHMADINVIKTAFAGLTSKCRMDFSFKYSNAHMYSAEAPKYIYDLKFLDHIGNSKFFLTVRDDDWYYLRGGSDPAFARAYFKKIPGDNFEGFYLGPDGYTWGREYVSKTTGYPRQSVIKKRWYSFQILGKLSYDPDLPDAHFEELLKSRFKEVNAGRLYAAWAKASQVMPLINTFHNERSQLDFQWYPEACTGFYGFHTVDNFINSAPQQGEGLMSIPEFTSAFLNNERVSGTTPLEVAEKLKSGGDKALSLIAGMVDIRDKELRETIGDIKAMALLGLYYSSKIEGATYKDIYDKATDPVQKTMYRQKAIKSLQGAAVSWKKYAAQVNSVYIPQHLTRMHFTIDFKAMQADVDKEVTMLTNKLPEFPFDNKSPLRQLEVVFSNFSNYYFWHVNHLGLPANWSNYKYVMLELFATGRQAFDLVLQTNTDTIVAKDIRPAENNWKRIVVPLETFTHNVSPANEGAPNAAFNLGEVLGLGLSIQKPVDYPVLEIRSIKLLKEGPDEKTASASIHLNQMPEK